MTTARVREKRIGASAPSVIDREQTVRFSRRDCERLLYLLDNPPKPNARFKAAEKDYQKLKVKRSDADSSYRWKP